MNDFKFIDDKSTDTQAFIMANDSFVTLCYRGTESIRDWVTNLNFVLVCFCYSLFYIWYI